MKHNPNNFKVGDIVIRDKGTASENKVKISHISKTGMFVGVESIEVDNPSSYTSMMNRLSPIPIEEQKPEILRFKTLMYGHIFVDSNRLGEGIYECIKPHLYYMEETIESKIEMAIDLLPILHTSPSYFKNLKQCKLVEIEITIKR